MNKRLPWLDVDDPFPPVAAAFDDPPGLLAAGADLSPNRLLDAYTRGIFPWYSEGEPILWWSPAPRCVLLPGAFHATRSLRKTHRRGTITITANHAFDAVMRACATAGERSTLGTWITADMFRAYSRLHRLGWGHSVETWHDGRLVGGVYGLAIGKVFFGESMFSTMTDASKLALWHLCRALDALGFTLFDAQMETAHLRSLGAVCLSRAAFTEALAQATDPPVALPAAALQDAVAAAASF